MKVSIVTSLYYSAQYVDEFYSRFKVALEQLGLEYEFIFVNDGSPDHSAEVVKKIIDVDVNVMLVSLSRNFGQYPAMFAGLNFSNADLIYICDCDLEEKPELIIDFYKIIIDDSNIDVVYGVVEERKGGFVRKKMGAFFFKFLDILSDFNIPKNQAWARLMRKNYVDNLLKYNESETMPAGLMQLVGFRQVPYLIEKQYKGSTTYSTWKRVKVAISSITSFSSKPLFYITFIGFFIFIASFLFILGLICQKFFFTDFQVGWSSIIASVWCTGGLIIFCIGIIGFYIAKIFNQVKNRPLYIVKHIQRNNEIS